MTDILFHPIRLRIVQSMRSGTTWSTAELHQRIPDVPASTLYRHVRTLSQAGILEVVEERAVRGTIERHYALVQGAGHVTPEQLAHMDRDQHTAAFGAFVAGLIAAFSRSIENPGFDLQRDGVSYRQVPVQLSDSELTDLAAAIDGAVARVAQAPDPGDRRTRLLTMIVLPEQEEPDSEPLSAT